jgi:hypothetical protein
MIIMRCNCLQAKLISSRRYSWLLTLFRAGYLVKSRGGFHGDVVVLVSCSGQVTTEEVTSDSSEREL